MINSGFGAEVIGVTDRAWHPCRTEPRPPVSPVSRTSAGPTKATHAHREFLPDPRLGARRAGVPRADGRPGGVLHDRRPVRAGRDERGGHGWAVLGDRRRPGRPVVRRRVDGAAGRGPGGDADVRAYR